MSQAWKGVAAGFLLAVLTLSWLWWVLKGRAWLRKCKRRRGGVYLVRTRRHGAWWRRENGYVGESVHMISRKQDHLGTGRYGHAAKHWSDLDPIWRYVIRLPWWLCWKWILWPLETLVIWCTWPRYNTAKNRWNPRRIPLAKAKIQRINRDRLRLQSTGMRGRFLR
jgi:hypothetical protein